MFPDLSVAENVFIGREPLRSGRRIDFKTMNEEIAVIVDRLGVRLGRGRIREKGLSVADQQIMEIAKALSLNVVDHCDGRADRGIVRPRSRPPLRDRRNCSVVKAQRCCSFRIVSRRSSISVSGSR